MFEVKKIFDSSKIPSNLLDILRAQREFHNGSYMEIDVNGDWITEDDPEFAVVEWLLANGAEVSDNSVAIHFWW